MSGRARRYKDGRNRGRDRGNSMREGVWRPGRAAHARNLARYAGPLRAVARGVFSAQHEKDFFCRQGTGAVLGFLHQKRRAIMAVDIVMPQMGESIFEGTITKWLKKPGDKVERDEPLFEISTDKVDAEIPSPSAGVLKEIKVGEGQTVPIQTIVGVIDAAGSAASAPAPTPAPAPPPAPAKAPVA